MRHMSYSVTCDFCGKTAQMFTQHVASTETLTVPDRASVFGKDICNECLELAKDAIAAALPVEKNLEKRPS